MTAWFEDLPLKFSRDETRSAERLVLAGYPTNSDALALAENAGVDPSRLNQMNPPSLLVREMLQEARRAGRLRTLIDEVLADPNQAAIHDELRALMAGDEAAARDVDPAVLPVLDVAAPGTGVGELPQQPQAFVERDTGVLGVVARWCSRRGVTVDADASARGKRRIRLSRKATGIMAAAVVVAVVAAVAATVMLTRSGGSTQQQPAAPAPTSAPSPNAASSASDNPNNLSANEIDLLKLSTTDYNRTSCRHFDTFGLAKAIINCDGNPSTGAPPAMFYSFTNLDQLHTFFSKYTQLVTTTNCPGDPPGADGPAKNSDGTQVGRRACYINKVGGDPTPTTIVTHDSTLVMGQFSWDGPGGAEGLNNWAYGSGSTDGGLPDKPTDPDFFTPADLDLLSRFAPAFGKKAAYTTTNCRHMDPALQATAQLYCVSNPETGYPNAFVFNYGDLPTVRAWITAIEARVGNGCAEGTAPPDEAWILNGRNVGRHSCPMDSLYLSKPSLSIYATNESKLWAAEFATDREGYPYPVPRNGQELQDWFNQASA